MLRSTADRYGTVARSLHWSIALLMVALFALGWYMTEINYYNPWYTRAFDWHKGVGMLMLGLALARLIWSRLDRGPALPEGMNALERAAARSAHFLLYAMTLLIPISGYFISTADGSGIDVFGWFEVPALLPASNGREELAGTLHYYLAFGTAYLVGLHALAALKHQFLNRDGTLSRMLGRPDPKPSRVTPGQTNPKGHSA
jgi:cytochrome b561